MPWIGTLLETCSFYHLTQTPFQKHGVRFNPVIQADQEHTLRVLREAQAAGTVRIWPDDGVDTVFSFVYLNERGEPA